MTKSVDFGNDLRIVTHVHLPLIGRCEHYSLSTSGHSAERDGGYGLLWELGTALLSATRSQKSKPLR